MSEHSKNSESPRIRSSEGDFMRLLMLHEPALRAVARTLLPQWNLVDEVIAGGQRHAIARIRSTWAGGRRVSSWSKVIVRSKCLSVIGALRRDRHVFSDAVLELLADEAESLDAGDSSFGDRIAPTLLFG